MNIKSILLGSAAALLAVGGARAADAVVVAEPEPVEYVRVCDVYGAGFFYIPGTETCLQISGEVRYQITAGDNQWPSRWERDPLGGWVKTAKGRVNFDARSETEWGTLRGFIRFDSEWSGYNTYDGPVVVDHAFIELGGLRIGYTESAWAQTQYGGASNWGGHSDTGLSYGYQQRDLIAYSFQGGNGFFGTLSLEEDEDYDNYVPDVVGVLGVTQGWGAVWAKAAYDESTEEFAGSIGAHIDIPNMAGSSLRVVGFYASGFTDYGVSPYFFPVTTSEWSVLASYQHQVNEKLAAIIGAQYFNNVGFTGLDGWQVEGSVVWTPVTNFEVRAEVSHARVDGYDGRTGGWLRFTRYF